MESLKPKRRAPSERDLVHTESDAHDKNSATTTVYLNNLHCSSCVQTIDETLFNLQPAPYSVQTSIVSQAVTINHPTTLLYSDIKNALEDAGFDIATEPIPGPSRPLPHRTLTSRRHRHIQHCSMCQKNLPAAHEDHEPVLSEAKSGSCVVSLSIGGMTCASCSNTITDALAELPGVRDVSVSLLSNSATVTLDDEFLSSTVTATIEDIGYEAAVMDVKHNMPAKSAPNAPGPQRLTLSIGGMTCASCVSTISALLGQMDGVLEVSIDLLGNSGSVHVERPDLADEVVNAIQDAGYEATVVSTEPVHEASPTEGPQARTLSLLVDGMFCSHCPPKIMESLEVFGSRVTIEKPLTERDPILRLSYQPSPPSLTVRDIVDAVASTNSPPFNVSVYEPPSLEDRAHAMQSREQRHILYRLLFSVVVAIPTFIIGIVYMSLVPDSDSAKQFFMRPMWTGNSSRMQWALFFLATPVMFYSAGMYHLRSFKEIRALWRRGSRTPIWRRFVRFGSMNLLVSAGVSVAYFSSIVLLALSASQPAGDGDTTTYFDSVVFLTMFLLMGRYLEAYSKTRTADAIADLGKLRPADAYLLIPGNAPNKHSLTTQDGNSDHDIEKGDADVEAAQQDAPSGSRVQKVSVDLLEVGDIVRVQNGSTPPADGTVVAGESSFDESSLTGESRPVRKTVGDQVFLGTINTSRAVDVRIDAIGGETMLDHVVRAVREGQTKRAPIERIADVLTGYFVPVVTMLAISTWVIWLGLGYGGALPENYLDNPVGGWAIWSLKFAIAVFVVACPCGIGLASPTALLVGSGIAAKYGILVRGGGAAFQEAAQLDIVVFDKTGTLTQGGEPSVTDHIILSGGDWKEEVILGMADELESSSTHPIASAIRRFCSGKGAVSVDASEYDEKPGRGLKASFTTRQSEAIIGNERWMEEHDVDVPQDVAQRLDAWKAQGWSVVLLAIRSAGALFELAAVFAVSDPLRPQAAAVIAHLQERGLKTWMISGDNATTAEAVAKQVGIPASQVIAGVLPHEKAEKIRSLQSSQPARRCWLSGRRLNERSIVAMVGDGINDAPALASADVGIAIGSGSDVALSSASFVLVSSELTSLITLFDLSRTVFRRVKFNFLWALVYNVAAIPIAAGVIYPAGHARLDPVWGSLAMALSSVSVVCSSIALRLYRPPRAPAGKDIPQNRNVLPM
ncbi:heavy metal translocatin [Peniophora sp. CONT]|nr:heavy metal translocatin [Peniophora sp. CONT]